MPTLKKLLSNLIGILSPKLRIFNPSRPYHATRLMVLGGLLIQRFSPKSLVKEIKCHLGMYEDGYPIKSIFAKIGVETK